MTHVYTQAHARRKIYVNVVKHSTNWFIFRCQTFPTRWIPNKSQSIQCVDRSWDDRFMRISFDTNSEEIVFVMDVTQRGCMMYVFQGHCFCFRLINWRIERIKNPSFHVQNFALPINGSRIYTIQPKAQGTQSTEQLTSVSCLKIKNRKNKQNIDYGKTIASNKHIVYDRDRLTLFTTFILTQTHTHAQRTVNIFFDALWNVEQFDYSEFLSHSIVSEFTRTHITHMRHTPSAVCIMA